VVAAQRAGPVGGGASFVYRALEQWAVSVVCMVTEDAIYLQYTVGPLPCKPNMWEGRGMPRPKITLLKSGNRLVVDPTTPRVYDTLAPLLTFQEKELLVGWERKRALENDEPVIRFTDWECFGQDHRDRLACGFGFWKRIRDALVKRGYRVVMRDLQPPPDPSIFEPQWDRLRMFDIELREDQPEFLRKLLANRCGCFDCATGFGKSYMIGLVGLLLPKARIDIVSKAVAVIRDRIYPELATMLPDVGIVGGGKKLKDRRVMCYSIDSSHHSPHDADILFGDEAHQLASDDAAYRLGKWTRSRNYGLSATLNKRLDNKDLRVEGIFGPILMKVSYQQAQAARSVVPIEVHWRPVVMDYDICEGEEDFTKRKRRAIWTNDFRNDLIAEDANLYDDDVQTLICVETIEHAVHLKKRLPKFTLVYMEDGLAAQKRHKFIRAGYLPPREPLMTLDRKIALTKAFEAGELKKAIVTTIWNVGVDFKHLQVLIRGDGGGSPVNDTQIPGRVSRIGPDKDVGIVHDYMDQFNTGFRRKARSREKSYAEHGWTQHFPTKARKGTVEKQLGFEFAD